MNSFEFYKSLYEREISKKQEIESSFSNVLTIFSLIVIVNTYLIEKLSSKIDYLASNICLVIIGLITILLIAGLFYFIKAFNNFFRGIDYDVIGSATGFREYEKKLQNYNNAQNEEKVIFENEIINKLNEITDQNCAKNLERRKQLFRSKNCLILAALATILHIIFIPFQMSAETQKTIVEQPAPKPERPVMPTNNKEKAEMPTGLTKKAQK